MSATYYSTSYGAVSTIASSPGDHPDAKAISISNPDGTTSKAYEMDLRYYELKAKAANEAALEAQQELAKAQANAEQQTSSQATKDKK